MSNHEGQDAIDSLVEWHLGLMSDEDRARFEGFLAGDAELRAKSERLGRILRPLDHWSVSTEPAHLAGHVLAAIERSGSQESATTVVAAAATDGPRVLRFPFGRFRDLAAAAACIVVLLGVSVPGMSALRERSRRTLCANNLGEVFRGLSAYQGSFAGSLPFAGFARNASWLPESGDRGAPASNSRHVFLLVKHRYVPRTESFICPCAPDSRPLDARRAALLADFADSRNVCYDSLNLAGPTPNLRPALPIAYLADTNPLFVGARFNDGIDPQRANSPAHGGRGQTVLFLDGRVEYLRSPIYGSQKDNVWVIEGVRRYTGREAPQRPDDAFLVPGFPAEPSPSTH